MKKILHLLLISLMFISISSCSNCKKNKDSSNEETRDFYNKIEITSKDVLSPDMLIEAKYTVANIIDFYTVDEVKIVAPNFIIYTADGTEYNDSLNIKREDFEKNGSISTEDNWQYYIETFKFKLIYDGPMYHEAFDILFYAYATSYDPNIDNPCETMCDIDCRVKNGIIILI